MASSKIIASISSTDSIVLCQAKENYDCRNRNSRNKDYKLNGITLLTLFRKSVKTCLVKTAQINREDKTKLVAELMRTSKQIEARIQVCKRNIRPKRYKYSTMNQGQVIIQIISQHNTMF